MPDPSKNHRLQRDTTALINWATGIIRQVQRSSGSFADMTVTETVKETLGLGGEPCEYPTTARPIAYSNPTIVSYPTSRANGNGS